MYIELDDLSDKDSSETLDKLRSIDLANLPVAKKGWNHLMEPGAHSALVHPGLDVAQGRFVLVQGGLIKVFDRELLKRQGMTGEFVFFSSLPYELRAKVIKHTLSSRQIHAVEFVNPTGPGATYHIIGAERPMMCKVSKQAIKDLTDTGIYKPLFQLHYNNKKILFSSRHDSLLLTSQFGAALAQGPFNIYSPRIPLPVVMRNMDDLMSIKSLHMDCQAFMTFLNWAADNIDGMPFLKEVHLHMTLVHPQFTRHSQESFQFECKPGQTRYLLVREFVRVHGSSAKYGRAAVHSFCASLDPSWYLFFSDLHGKLDHLLGLGHLVMPELVKLSFWCAPAPAPLVVASSGN